MKKLFFASIVMLATLTACNNETPATAQEETQNQTFSASKTTARETALTPDEEKANIEESIAFVKSERQKYIDGFMSDSNSSKKAIQCHTDYFEDSGHACVFLNGYMEF